MKKLKSFEDFEDALKNTPVPEFNENLIIGSIHVIEGKMAIRFKIKTLILLTTLLIFMISSIVFGKNLFKPVVRLYNVISSISLHDETGKVIYNYQEVEYDEEIDYADKTKKVNAINKEYSYIMYKHKKELKDNELELFIVVDAYKVNGSVNILYNDKRFNTLSDLIKNSSVKFKTPNLLPDKYVFKYGYIKRNYSIDNNLGAVADELYNKAVKENEKYIYQRFESTGEPTEIYLNYAENNGQNDIELIINREYREFENDSIKVENIDISGQKALYKVYDNSTLREITFVHKNELENLTYTIKFSSSTYLYNDLYPYIIKMIESMF